MTVRYETPLNPDGAVFGQTTAEKLAFWNATPVSQPTNAAQAAITDNSGGTAAPTTGVVAVASQQTILIPVQLADLAAPSTWKVALPFAFTVTGVGFRTGKPASTGGKAATLTAQVNGVAVTGGVVSLTTANQNATGTLTTGTAITALNTGTAGQTVEVAVSAVTTFVEGDGYVELTVTNNSLANAIATILAQTNRFRTDLVNIGLIKGA